MKPKVEPQMLVKQRAKSKTYWLGMAIVMLSFAQANFAQIAAFMGEYSSAVNFCIGMAICVMRELTKSSLSAKA